MLLENWHQKDLLNIESPQTFNLFKKKNVQYLKNAIKQITTK